MSPGHCAVIKYHLVCSGGAKSSLVVFVIDEKIKTKSDCKLNYNIANRRNQFNGMTTSSRSISCGLIYYDIYLPMQRVVISLRNIFNNDNNWVS